MQYPDSAIALFPFRSSFGFLLLELGHALVELGLEGCTYAAAEHGVEVTGENLRVGDEPVFHERTLLGVGFVPVDGNAPLFEHRHEFLDTGVLAEHEVLAALVADMHTRLETGFG